MICQRWGINKIPIRFSINFLDYREKEFLDIRIWKSSYILLISPNNIEYKGEVRILDKKFNFVLKNCLKLYKYNLRYHLSNFEIMFVRGENVLNFLPVVNKKL
jgi:small nuclear ribonucleoprotein (snRNP)-like protein